MSAPAKGRTAWPQCLVPGCSADLFADGEASVRFRTCLAHRKAVEVDLRGTSSRYCQQCTKFHPLTDFDGMKHGCRKRLNRHNMRRQRKKARRRQIAGSVVFPEAAGISLKEGYEPIVHVNADATETKGSPVTLSPTNSQAVSDAEKQLPTGANMAYMDPSMSPQDTVSSLQRSSGSALSAVDVGGVFDLSDSDTLPATSGAFGPAATGLVWQQAAVCDPMLQQTSMGYQDLHPDGAALGSDVCSDAFSWQSCSSWEEPPNPALPGVGLMRLGMPPPATAPALPGSYKTFEELELELYHLDMKIAGITPAGLPSDLGYELMSYHKVMPCGMEGTIRPGCLHLSVDFTMGSGQDRRAALSSFLSNLQMDVASGAAAARNLPWAMHDTTVLLPNAVVKASDQGRTLSVLPRPEGPIIHSTSPVVACGVTTSIEVSNLGGQDFAVLCRIGGKQHKVEITAVTEHPSVTGHHLVEFCVPQLDSGFAWIEVLQDAAGEILLSKPWGMLLTDWEEVAAEVSTLTHDVHALRRGHIDCFLRDVGAALHASESPPLSVYATCLSRAARLGFPDTFEALADEAVMRGLSIKDVINMANARPGGNLASQAAQSGSLATLETVSVVLTEAEVPVGAADIDAESGMSALHWAAAARSRPMISLLIDCTAGALAAWKHLPGGEYGLASFEMFAREAAQPAHGQPDAPLHQREMAPVEPPGAVEASRSTVPIDPVAIFVVFCVATAALIASAPSKCASMFLLLQGAVLITSWFCYFQYTTISARMGSLAESAGIELSRLLAPVDTGVDTCYCTFVAARMSSASGWCFGGLLTVVPLMANLFSHLNHGPQISAGSLAMVALYVSAAVLVRQFMIRRAAVRMLERFNMAIDTSLYFIWMLSFWIVLQAKHVRGAEYTDSVFELPWAAWLILAVSCSLLQATLLSPPLYLMVPFRVLGLLFLLAQVSLSNMIYPVEQSLKTDLGTLLLAFVVSSGVYIATRLSIEQENLSAFLAAVSPKAGKHN